MALGRHIFACLALLAAGIALLGCGGSDEPSGAQLEPETAADLQDKLDQVQQRAGEGKCNGDNSAESSLDSVKVAAAALPADTDEEFVSNLNELLDRLGQQLSDQCDSAQETTETSSTEEPAPPTTAPSTTVPATTAPPSTESSTTDHQEETPPPPDEAPPANGNGPPSTPPGQGGGGPGTGGTSPGGFESGRKAGSDKKPKPDRKPREEKR